MEQLMLIAKWLLAHYQELLVAIVALITAVIAICMFIPGDEPEKTLQKILDVISKFSRKAAKPIEEDKK